MEKYCTAGEATDDNMMHAHLTLGTEGNQHKLSEYITLTVYPLQQWLHERATLRYVTLRYVIRTLPVLLL